MHQLVVEDVCEYLEQNKDLRRFFDRLRNVGKKMFLVTNSPFHFVYDSSINNFNISINQIQITKKFLVHLQ